MARKFYRSRTDSMVGGICGGLAEYFDIDPTLVRLGTVLLVLAGGYAILAYVIIWIVVPQKPLETALAEGEKEPSAKIEAEGSRFYRTGGITFAGIVLILLGVLFLLNNIVPFVWLSFHKLWPVILVVVGIMIIVKGRGGRDDEG